ncbi:hypothetical protein BLNAU_4020 [Blattamonas nauphoetae]|uniref:Mediator complex subunit 5 n=1 Tax=Blattamonas nauphoetae TaxID=2049346 RepID=A0ABQ9YAX8_9EUKA|nr:hypothetical protein BLNAU_4020 [Blattamonas nauphoetae]
MKKFDYQTISAAEKNPSQRFKEFLDSYTNTKEHNPQSYQKTLITLLRRFLNHMPNDERHDLLHRFGTAMSQRTSHEVDIESLTTIGLFLEICPLVSITPLSEDLSSLFRSFLCDPQPYLINDNPSHRASISMLMKILCNEYLAYSITGCGEALSEIVDAHFASFIEAISGQQIDRPSMTQDYHPSADFHFQAFTKIKEISQIITDPVERIAAFIDILPNPIRSQRNDDENYPMNLLSQCLQHTATFLTAHPDRIDSLLERITVSSSPSDTPFRHDRDLTLISTLSQSSSPLFTKHTDTLLDPTFPFHDILSPRSFTDPASSFFRMASTNPSFFHRLVKKHAEQIVDSALSTALWTVRVVSEDPSEPRCLDFGRATQNWVVLLNTMAEVRIDLLQHRTSFNGIVSSLLTLLVLSAASTNDDLSTAAVSTFSSQCSLSRSHTEALLFDTPTTFPLSDAFLHHHTQTSGDMDHRKGSCESICAEAGRCVEMHSRRTITKQHDIFEFVKMLGIPFTGCLVNALYSTTSLPHAFPFISSELCGLSQQPSVWNDTSKPSPLTSLTTLANIEISRAYRIPRLGQNLNHEDEMRRDTNFVHLFPFLGVDFQTLLLSSFNTFVRSHVRFVPVSLDRVVECLIEMATVHSYNTPVALLTETRNVAELLSSINVAPDLSLPPRHVSPMEMLLVEKLRTAEGEERWRLVTQLAVVSKRVPDFTEELTKVENDAQALFILSIHTIRSTPRLKFLLDSNPDAFHRVVEFSGHINNLPLVSTALAHIVDTVDTNNNPHAVLRLLTSDENKILFPNVLNALRVMAARRREEVEVGHFVGKDEMTSQIVDSCLKVLRSMMKIESFDPTPSIDYLVPLVVTTYLPRLRDILLLLQKIEERTQNTSTPFSICTATAPFRSSLQSSVTQQPLPSIIASILLSASLDTDQTPSQRYDNMPTSGFVRTPFLFDSSNTASLLLRELDENLIVSISKEAAKSVSLTLEERRTSCTGKLTSDGPFVISLAQKDRRTTPQQLVISLHRMNGSFFNAARTHATPEFVHLSRSVSHPHRNSIHSLHTPSRHHSLSTLPLSSLLSVLSVALVRLDTIPSSLPLFNRFNDLFTSRLNQSNPKVGQFVLALREDGIEDRRTICLCEEKVEVRLYDDVDSSSLTFLNEWFGANAKRNLNVPDFNDQIVQPLLANPVVPLMNIPALPFDADQYPYAQDDENYDDEGGFLLDEPFDGIDDNEYSRVVWSPHDDIFEDPDLDDFRIATLSEQDDPFDDSEIYPLSPDEWVHQHFPIDDPNSDI